MKNIRYLLIIFVIILFLSSCANNDAKVGEDKLHDLNTLRADFKTDLLYEHPAPQGYDEKINIEGAKCITYSSDGRDLKAWITDVQVADKKYPAVVYVHGGFSFGETDYYDAEPYYENGYVVMAITLRGENANDGNFELFYGEVDDVIAAGNYLANLPYIDKDRVFVSGHSTGGTLAMLTALLDSSFKAAASFGASPDQKKFFKYWRDIVPFDIKNKEETRLRSPIEFPYSLKIPLKVYVGSEDSYLKDSKAFVEQANSYGKECYLSEVDGDHFTSLLFSVEDSVDFFDMQ